MNNVILVGRITKDPDMRYTSGQNQIAVARFNLAIERPYSKVGEKQVDFPGIVVFGKQAENCEKYLKKGRQVAIQGRIQTGSYTNKDGATVYTTDVVADRVQFLEWGDRSETSSPSHPSDPIPTGFEALADDIPF